MTTHTAPALAAPALSVWATAQRTPATQRKDRYTRDAVEHPAKMLPAVAAHAIAHYTQPGDLVLDPMCGIGTTLVEALHLDRRALGIEYESRWVEIAQHNLARTRRAGITTNAHVLHGDARQLTTLLPAELHGRVDLVVTSPPYGAATHGQVRTLPTGVHKNHYRYGNPLDRGNLANVGHHRLLTSFTTILAAARTFLRDGGHVIVTLRPWREYAELVDLPTQITECGQQAGLTPTERCVALLARLNEGDLVHRASFFQRDFIRRQRQAGLPLHLIAHEDVLIFRKQAVQ